jgi:hypothetical protein
LLEQNQSQILNTDDEIRKQLVTTSKVGSEKATNLNSMRSDEIDELKKIFFEFFAREIETPNVASL